MQLHRLFALGDTLAINSAGAVTGLAHYEVATGAAGAEIPKATVIDALSAFCSISGIVDDVVSVTAAASDIRDITVGPLVLPASTRIAMRSVLDSAPSVRSTRFYLSGFDVTSLPNFVRVPGVDALYAVGSRLLTTAPMVALASTRVTAAAAWSFGNYAEVVASLVDETLVVGLGGRLAAGEIGTTGAQFDVALGAEGSEVIQARAGLPPSTYMGAGLVCWPYCFIAHKGERLAVRVAAGNTGRLFDVVLYGVRLS